MNVVSLKDEETLYKSARQHLDQCNHQLQRKQWRLAKKELLKVIDNVHQYMQCYSSHSRTTLMVEILVSTGKHLNRMLDHKQAVTCFNTAMCLISGSNNKTPHQVKAMCDAFSSLVQTFLFLKDLGVASSMIKSYKDCLLQVEYNQDVNQDVNWCLGSVYLDLGLAQLDQTLCTSAAETLEESRNHLLRLDGNHQYAEQIARMLSALGYSYLCTGNDRASDYLLDAVQAWQRLNYPIDEYNNIIDTMKYYVETQLRSKNPDPGNPEVEISKQMLNLHRALQGKGFDLQVPDAFIYMGKVAFQKESEQKAVNYFEQALELYNLVPKTETSKDVVLKLLWFIGVSYYNCRDFHKAVKAYTEYLEFLEANYTRCASKVGHVAECFAALGFTYSRLRNFENMLKYYEKALELRNRLMIEDLELIETNIGNLYHVKAANYEQEGNREEADRYHQLAGGAFNKALAYSWKSFPFINYGYYLLCRGDFTLAAQILQQGYLNGVIDKDTVEFDHTEDPILLDDLKFELEGREDIRMPSAIIALYLKTLAQSRMGNIVGAKNTATQLQQEVKMCKYETFYIEAFGLERMKALCYSLLGYAYRSIGCNVQAYSAFQSAVAILPDYRAALNNLRAHRSSIVNKTGK